MKNNKIYFDHAATTPVDPKVLKAMVPYLNEKFGNPSSLHTFGQEAVEGVDQARDQVAEFLGCSAQEVVFTSGATEADNLAIQGVVKASKLDKPHIITSTIEHPAVLEACKKLEKKSKAEVDYVKVTQDGLVKVEEVKKLIKNNTILISIMYVNNEVGTIQPVREVGKILEKINKERDNRIYFHTDAVQAINYLNCNVLHLHVDLLSLSGHKIYGPKGIGVLYVRDGTPIQSIQFGGHQEYDLRPGTLNVPAIVGLAKAIKLIQKSNKSENQKIRKLRDKLLKGILEKIPDVKVNGNLTERMPNNLNISFKNVEGESILLMLDLEGIAISTGSACASGSLEPSHVLMAMGLSHAEAHGSLRITLGKGNTDKEVDKFLEILFSVIGKLRGLAPK